MGWGEMSIKKVLLTTADLECLLWYYARADEPAKNDPLALEGLLKVGLLEESKANNGRRFSVSAKGEAHVMNMMNLPLPEAKWSVPWEDK